METFGTMLLKAVLALVGLLTLVAYTVYLERRICAFIQDRLGPNRAGPAGLLQPLADAVKAFLKEDFTPPYVRKFYYWLAPALAMLPGLLNIAVIPFGSKIGSSRMVVADLNIGILYYLAIGSLGVYAIVLAGYASNSKYPQIGGIRAAAQMISYEITLGLSVVPILLLVGSLNLSRMIEAQAGSLWDWMIFRQPLSFVLFFSAAFAETNRLPVDLPEAEQELAGGYNVEYSSMKLAMFFLGEYANLIAVSAIIATLFLGGWTLPWWGLNHPASTVWIGILQIGIFLAKTAVILLVFIWARWMLPRLRYDQLMELGWKRLLPLALANVVLTAVWMWWQP